jgi:hypothetical protein
MTEPVPAFQGRIARSDLAALLDAAGTPSRLSPRPTLGPAAPRPPQVSPVFAEAARALLDPGTNLTLRIWGGESAASEMNVLFPGLPAAGQGVALNLVGHEFRMAGFIDADEVLGLVSPLLPPEPPTKPERFEIQLDAAMLAVLAAGLDLAGRRILERRVARVLEKQSPGKALLIDAEPLAGVHIKSYLKAMWGLSRFDQLITYVFPLAARVNAPTDAEIDAALEGLCRLRLFAAVQADRFMPAPALEPVLRALLGASAGFQWQRLSALGSKEILVVERIFVLGGGGVALELSPTPEGLIHLALRTRADIVDFLVGELGASAAMTAPVASPIAAVPRPSYCGQCGTALKPGWKFCGTCGAALMAEPS